jgi:hypothetical protein
MDRAIVACGSTDQAMAHHQSAIVSEGSILTDTPQSGVM